LKVVLNIYIQMVTDSTVDLTCWIYFSCQSEYRHCNIGRRTNDQLRKDLSISGNH